MIDGLEATMQAEAQEGATAMETNGGVPASTTQRVRNVKGIAGVAVLAVALGTGGWYYYTQGYETTDDAQIDGHINSISSRVTGTIDRVYVDDNQLVQTGQVLADLDPQELRIAADESAAQYAQAQAQLNSTTPNVVIAQNTNEAQIAMAQSQLADAQAGLAAAEHDRQSAAAHLAEAQAAARRDKAQADRYKQLFEKEETSRQEYESYTAAAQASQARLAAAEAGLASAEKVVEQRKSQLASQAAHASEVLKDAPHTLAVRLASAQSQRASVDLAHAQQARAELNLSYAHIQSPVTGVVTERSAEKGNRVQPGEQLMMVVDTTHMWVTANFKETQLRLMHAGCRASVKVDALGITYEGIVDSMPAITGARASVLPPENATGNYVKVVQRLPVRIVLTPGQPQMEKLRPGMSVEAKVELR